MNFKYTTCFFVCLLMMATALPGFSGSNRGNADLCDPEIIGQIKEGQSTKEDVKKLIGEPEKIESAFNQSELWKYAYQVTLPSGSAFKSSGRENSGSNGISIAKKNCTLFVYFEKTGIVKKVRESEISGRADL